LKALIRGDVKMRRWLKHCFLSIGLLACAPLAPAIALPPPQDTPEEILRTEIILDARSPIDGKPLTAKEYAELQAEIEQTLSQVSPRSVSPRLRELVFLLSIRRGLRLFLPFIP
jgi:hypothetical protein